LHKFYARLANPEDLTDENHPAFEMGHLIEPTCVKMERDYLKAWYIFEKEVDKL